MKAFLRSLLAAAVTCCVACSSVPAAGDGGLDAGSAADGGPPDGGAPPDAGARTDAGVADAGVAGPPDAGFPYDGGTCSPIPPRSLVDLTMPAITRSLPVPAGSDLQAALDNAQPGDELVLPAGAVFTGNYLLRPKAGWVVVRSSGLATLPPLGGRILPSRDSSAMARLQTSTASPAVASEGNAGFWRLVGLEVGVAAGNASLTNLIELGDGSANTLAGLPHDLVVDRCWIHGNDTGNARRGIALNGRAIGVVGNVIENFKEVGADSQALAGWNGAGPFAIVNNFLEGAAETVIFGGADPAVPNLVPSDIALLHNTLTKRLTWKADDASYAGVAYSVKNVLELKNARRVWVEGNIIEHSWPMGQVGYAIVLTPRNQGGNAPWSAVQDVSIVNNVIRSAAGGVNLLSSDSPQASQPMRRVRIWNNLFYDLGTPQWGTQTKTFQFLHGGLTASCLEVAHLTTDNGSTWAAAGDTPVVADQFAFNDNIGNRGAYGFFGSGAGEGTAALTTFFTSWSFSRNVLAGGATAAQYPAGNAFPAATADIGWVNPDAGDFHLSGTSPYKGQATDGTDPGANIDAVWAATR